LNPYRFDRILAEIVLRDHAHAAGDNGSQGLIIVAARSFLNAPVMDSKRRTKTHRKDTDNN
jgi:hypothetical protein